MLKQSKLFLTTSKLVIKSLFKNSKAYLVVSLFEILSSSIIPFIYVLLPTQIINNVINAQYKTAINYVILMFILNMIATVIDSSIKHFFDLKNEWLKYLYRISLMEKSMSINFEVAETATNLENKQKAERGAVNIIEYLNNIKILMSSLITLILASYLISYLNIILVLLILVVVVFNSFVNYKKNIAEHKRENDFAVLYRKWNYLNLVCRDKDYYKEIRLNHLHNWLSGKIRFFTQENEQLIRSSFHYTANARNASALGEAIQNVVIYLFIGIQVLKGIITIGDFIKYLTTVNLVSTSLVTISSSFLNMQKNCLIINSYFIYMDMPDQDDLSTQNTIFIKPSIDNTGGLIEIENIWFKYEGKDEYIFKNFSLTIKKGEKLSIVGINGAGKTTLVKLLLRLYKPERGVIKLNGIDIQEYDLKLYLKIFAVLFQDFKIYSFTVQDNVLMSDMRVDDNISLTTDYQLRLKDALEKAGMIDTIEKLDKKYMTYLNKDFMEDGIELSGGMSQNLAMSRAYFRDANIIIMDEPTAMLDPLHEYYVYTYMNDIIQKQTAVYISHRMSCSRFCDKIALITDGTVKEYGSHDELMIQMGLYYQLYKTQAEYYNEI